VAIKPIRPDLLDAFFSMKSIVEIVGLDPFDVSEFQLGIHPMNQTLAAARTHHSGTDLLPGSGESMFMRVRSQNVH